jgi:hypothetical protein
VYGDHEFVVVADDAAGVHQDLGDAEWTDMGEVAAHT